MKKLDYTVIKNKKQYKEYCNKLEALLEQGESEFQDHIELLSLLIKKWDEDHNSFNDLDPVQLIKELMDENNLKSKDLAGILDLSKGTVSKILNYQKGLSKETIRLLSDYFKVSQEAFNRPYKLINEVNRHFRNASLMNTKKDFGKALTA